MNVIGAVFIICGAFAVSLLFIRESKGRIMAYEAVYTLITFIKRNIEAFGTPVDGIFESCRIDYFDNCAFGDILRQKGLEAALREYELPLKREAQLDLETFAEDLGKGYSEDEIKRCEYYAARFEAYLSDEKDKASRYMPMYRYMPLLVAMSVIILLL